MRETLMTNQVKPDDNPRLLLVDDDVTFCSVLKRALERRGLSVVVAHTVDEALKSAEEFRPSLAVVDLKLADESGLHLIKPLLSLDGDMQIVVLTGYGSISTAVKAIKEGAANYLGKPVDVDAILAAFDGGDDMPSEGPEPTPMSLGRLEWEHIQRVLDEYNGNISATARRLGMHRRTLQRKLHKRPAKE